MTARTIKILMNEFFSKPAKKDYSTNKIDVCHIDDLWSLHLLDLKEYGPENFRKNRHILVVMDNFSKNGRMIPAKNKNAQIKKDLLENNFVTSKRKSNLIETDRGQEFFYSIFQNAPYNENIKQSSRSCSLGAV